MSRTNPQRSFAARRKILSVGRRLFAKHGYAETSTPMIAESAGLSRGALYHHFADKKTLFAAVVAAEYDRLARQIDEASSGATDPLERLVEGGDGFIAAASDPVSQRLLLIDGPAILGMDALLSADKATTTQSLQDGIEAAQVAGRLPKDISAAALTSLMSGAYDRAVLDGFGATPKARLAIRHAIREMWFGLSRRA